MGESADPAITLTWHELDREIRQAERTGLCTRPVRLTGRIDAIDLATGELRTMYDTTTEPGGVLLTACGNRRETICPPCSAVYKRDARQLVRAGLAGGKGIPDTIAAHPCVFATFTAPSFGPVHSRRIRGKTVLPCRPRRDAKQRRCPHGRDISCPRRHADTTPASDGPCPRLLQLHRRRAVQRRRRPALAPVPPTCPPPGPPRRTHPQTARPARPRPATSKSPNTRHAASSTTTPSSAWTPPATPTSHPRPGSTPPCYATPSPPPPQPSR